MDSLNAIYSHKVFAILRAVPFDHLIPIADALYAGGIRLLELTLNSPKALEGIAVLTDHFKYKGPDEAMLVGAGTVLNAEAARNAIAAGARYIISPNTDPATIRQTLDLGSLSLAGAYTPTEIVQAYNAGAHIVKVFPASSVSYFKDVRAPLNHIPMMPTGGVSIENIKDFKAAGAVAFGIGSSLVKANTSIDTTSLENLSVKARQLVQAVL